MRVYLLGTALAAAWLSVSRLHRLQSCDSLVFSLASLYRWTPFFWEQDRVGMLLPLLASPIRDPFWNLAALTGLMSFCGLLAPLLLARLVCPTPGAFAAVTIGNALLLAFAPQVIQENVLTTCVYPLAVCLGVPAVGLLDRPTVGRSAAALVLLVLAHWTYLGAAAFLLPLAAGRWLLAPSRGRFAAGVAVLLAFGLNLVLAGEWRRLHPEIPITQTGGLPVGDWPRNWLAFVTNVVRLDAAVGWLAAVSLMGAVGVAVAGRRTALVAVAPLVLAATAELLALGTLAWPAMNHHHPRYLLAALPAVWVAVLVAGWGPVLRGRWPAAVSITLLLAAVGWRFGPPSPANARAELDALCGGDTADLLRTEADAVGGEYMATWPAVWHLNRTRHELGLPTPVSGVTSKAAAWVPGWTGPFRLAAPFDQEEQARRWVVHYRLRVVGGPERVGRVAVLTVTPAD